MLSSTAVAFLPSSQLQPARAQSQTGPKITVRAGARDRRDTVVSFTTKNIQPGIYDLQPTSGGDAVPLQVDGEGRSWFVLQELKAGAERQFRLGGARSLIALVRAERGGDE